MVDRKKNWKERNNNFRLLWMVCLLFVLFFGLTGIVAAEDSRVPKEPPIVLAHMPGVDATQVPVNGSVSVVWDRPMQLDTNFSVTSSEGFVAGTFIYEPDTFTVTFLPDGGFVPDTRYGVLVAGQVDMNGLVQRETYQWNFNTVTPTSVSVVSFGQTEDGLGFGWLWSSWPWLMAIISIFSLTGFLLIWGHRRLVNPSN